MLAVPVNLGWGQGGRAHVDLVLLDEIDGTVIDRESGAAGYGSMIDRRDIF